MEQKIELLKEIGLSERESKTYIALLLLGSTTTGPLIEKTKIPASKIYETLKKLEEKGFVNHIIKKNQKHFQASNPEIILEHFEEKYNNFKKYVENLEKLRKFAYEEQFAEFYEGNKAIFSLIRNLIKKCEKGDDYFNFSFDDEFNDKALSSFFSGIAHLAYEKKLNIKMLTPKNKKKLLEVIFSKEYLKITNNKFTSNYFPEGLIIIKDDVILVEWEGKPSAVRIRCDTFANNFRNFFNDMYNRA